jgi:hypothetical protein
MDILTFGIPSLRQTLTKGSYERFRLVGRSTAEKPNQRRRRLLRMPREWPRRRAPDKSLGARLPTIVGIREFVQAGALMSYGPNFPDQFRRAAELVDKILRGTKPGDIPVEQPTKFALVINLTTAKALGVTIPPALLARADEVIE